MTEIVRTYRQTVPAMRFVRKKYGGEDRTNGGLGKRWREWFSKGWFEEPERSCDPRLDHEDGDATIGLMRWKEGEPFEYWIGIFCPEKMVVPRDTPMLISQNLS